jgi:hypothetical protein
VRRGPWRLLLPVAIAAAALALAAEAPDDKAAANRGFVEEVLAGGDYVVTEVMSFVARREVGIGPIEALALAVLVAWAAGLWRERRRACEPGSINVELFVNATGDKNVSAEGLTALVEDRLAGGGLLPAPALPSGAMATQFVELVEASPVPQAKWLGALLGLVRGLVSRPPRTYKLTGTIRSRDEEPPCGMSVELFDGRSGQLEAVATFWNDKHREAAKSAAGFVYARVMHGVVRCTPRWQTWTNLQGESVTEYQRGLECEQALIRAKGAEGSEDTVQSALDEALCHYGKACEREPTNLLVKLRIANLYELGNQRVKALESYLGAVERWAHVFDARYRLAISLTFADKVLEDTPKAQQDDLLDRLCKWMDDHGMPTQRASLSTGQGGKVFQPLGLHHLERLHRQIGFWHAVWDWLRTWLPSWSGRRDWWCERRLRGRLAVPWSRQRRERRNVVGLARVCTLTQLGVPTGDKDVDRYLRSWRAKNWQVRYNAACCYSRLFEIRGRQEPALGAKAVGQLELAYEEAGGHLEVGWIRTDPDLVPLQAADEFRPWLPSPA